MSFPIFRPPIQLTRILVFGIFSCRYCYNGRKPDHVLDAIVSPLILSLCYINFCVLRAINVKATAAILATAVTVATFSVVQLGPISIFISYSFYPKLVSCCCFPLYFLLLRTSRITETPKTSFGLITFGFLNLHVQNILWLGFLLIVALAIRLLIDRCRFIHLKEII